MKKLTLGILFIALGFLFLTMNLGLIPYSWSQLFDLYWPAILVLIGGLYLIKSILNLKGCTTSGSFFFPIMSVVIGMVLLGNRLDWFNGRYISIWQVLWPTIIVFVGISLLTPSSSFIHIDTHKKDKSNDSCPSDGFEKARGHKVNRSTIIGHTELVDEPWALEDGSINVGIGGTVVDLTKAFIKEGETRFNLSGAIGSIELYIPSTLAVDISASLSLGNIDLFNESYSGTPGSISYRSVGYDNASKRVKINISLNIGEIVVKQVE